MKVSNVTTTKEPLTPCCSRPPYGVQDRAFLRFGIRTNSNLGGGGEGRKAAAERRPLGACAVHMTERLQQR